MQFTISSLFLRVRSLDDIEVQMADETGYPLRWTISPIPSRWYSPRAYDTWHVLLQASTRCIMVRAPRAMWMQNASFSSYCEKCSLCKCGWRIEKSPRFSTIVLNGTYSPFVWARADCFLPSEALPLLRPPFDEMFKRAYTVKQPSRDPLSFECWKHSRINNGKPMANLPRSTITPHKVFQNSQQWFVSFYEGCIMCCIIKFCRLRYF